MSITRRIVLAVCALAAVSSILYGQAGAPTAHVAVAPSEVKWGPAPPSLPAGAQTAVLSGDPMKPGPFVITAKFPDGYRVPPHSHPSTENVTVVSGMLMVGMGDTANDAGMKALGAGGFSLMPARMNHYVRAKGDTTVIIHGTGPFEVTYVNPQDDPRKPPAAK